MSPARPHRRRTAIAALALATTIVAAAPAHAAPAISGEFALTGTPEYLALGPDGNVWTPLSGAPVNEIARIAPDGTVTEYDVPALAGAKGITAGPDGRLWATKPNAVVAFTPANPAGATATPIAGISDPRAITTGPDGKLWTGSGDKAVTFTPANPAGFVAHTVAGMGARGITSGGDGSLHIADFGSQRIVHLTTAGAATFTTVGGGPQEVAAGPGTQIGHSNPGAIPQTFGRTAGTALLGESPMGATDPFGIVLGNDGAYWTARFAAGDLGRVTAAGEVSSLSGFSPGAGPRYLTRGAGDTLWVGLETAKKVARVTGVAAPPPPPTPAPPTAPTAPAGAPSGTGLAPAAPGLVLSKLTASPRRFTARRALPTLTRSSKGAQLRFTITGPARVRFTFAKARTGRRVGKACVKRTRRNAARKPCRTYVAVPGSFTVSPKAAGSFRVRFGGRISRKRMLTPGRYRVTATATSGETTTRASTTFTIKAS